MKKLLALMLCALLALLPAMAEAPEDQPEAPDDNYAGDFNPPGEGPADETIELDIHGETVRLFYDSSPLYSSVQGGLVQASYYAYGSDGYTMYLLYIIFPETARSGMQITPEYAAMTGEECSVVLIVSGSEQERYYFSSVADGQVYPADSDFCIAIDSVDASGSGTAYAGTLSATLISLDITSGEAEATLSIPQTPFSFTIGGYQNRSADPASTPVPDDLRKV